ncbi:hypothetical protein BH24DEI1_BH24DEI1_15510 [soil metagenome]
MGIKIQRRAKDERQAGSSLLEVLSCLLFPSRWKGRTASELSRLDVQDKLPALLYFRSKGCVACGLVDMRVVQACLKVGVSLAIIDRHPGIESSIEEGGWQDGKVGTVADYDGVINRA